MRIYSSRRHSSAQAESRPAGGEALEEEAGVEDGEAGAALCLGDRQEGEALTPRSSEGGVSQPRIPVGGEPVSEGASSGEESLLGLIELEVHGGPISL